MVAVAANVKALAMWRHSVLRLAEPMLDKCTNVRCLFYSPNTFGHAGTKAD